MVKEDGNVGGNVFPRRLDRPMPRVGKAEGVWIEDTEGRRYLDASGGAVVVNVGHCREEIARAVSEQISTYDYIHPTMFTTPVVEKFATALASHTPAGLDRFYFLSGGAEGVETAIKLARQIHLAADRPQKIRLVSRWKSYHGLTLGALSAMGRTAFRAPYAPLLSDAVHIFPPYCLRCSYGLQFPECRLRCALALEETILNLGPETVSAFIAETVSGGTLAAYPPPEGYFSVIREICDRYDVLLILDEVMCGMGRTGRWFACEHQDVIPDMITLGKGLSGGTVALSAVAVKSEHFDLIREKSGVFAHGGTFTHHSVAAAAGLAVVRILERERLVERVARYGSVLGDMLRENLCDLPWTADIRGIGFLWGIELVRDRKTNAPFNRKEQITEKLWEAMFQKGVIVYKSTGIAGFNGDALIVAPPFIIKMDEMRRVAEALRETILETIDRGFRESQPSDSTGNRLVEK